MVVDAVTRNWVMVVLNEEAGMEGFGRAVQALTVLLYEKNGILEYPRIDLIQKTLEVLTGLFDWVGLWTNMVKVVGMTFQTC